MTDVSWPGWMPAHPLADGYSEQWPDGAIRSDMEVGSPKYRGRTTSDVTPFSLTYGPLTYAQLQSFEDWWRQDVRMGARAVLMPHPRDPARTVLVRVLGGIKPIYYRRKWRVSFQIEVQP